MHERRRYDLYLLQLTERVEQRPQRIDEVRRIDADGWRKRIGIFQSWEYSTHRSQ